MKLTWILAIINLAVNALVQQYNLLCVSCTLRLRIWMMENMLATCMVRLLIDFEKAFHVVNHTQILQKMFSLGISSALIRFSFLLERRHRVKYADHLYNWSTMIGSKSQGSFLGQLCYKVFLSMISICVRHTSNTLMI